MPNIESENLNKQLILIKDLHLQLQILLELIELVPEPEFILTAITRAQNIIKAYCFQTLTNN